MSSTIYCPECGDTELDPEIGFGFAGYRCSYCGEWIHEDMVMSINPKSEPVLPETDIVLTNVVMVDSKELEYLRERDKELTRLEEAGVDNWENY